MLVESISRKNICSRSLAAMRKSLDFCLLQTQKDKGTFEMKFAVKIMFILFCALLLTGCGEKPASVAEKFTNALAKGDFEEAKKYATDNAGQMLDFIAGLGGGEKKQNFKFVLIKEEIEGDKATVYFKDGVSGGEESIILVKKDGKWKAEIPKQ